jgi:hypothetical protein
MQVTGGKRKLIPTEALQVIQYQPGQYYRVREGGEKKRRGERGQE